MELIKQDSTNARELRVRLQAPQQHACRRAHRRHMEYRGAGRKRWKLCRDVRGAPLPWLLMHALLALKTARLVGL